MKNRISFRVLLFSLLLSMILLTLTSCSPFDLLFSIGGHIIENSVAEGEHLYNRYVKYDVDWMMGKTSAEIIERYGEFNCCLMPPCEDGLYRNCRCGYTIRERTHGFMDAIEEKILFIHFDGNGVAHSYDWDGYRPGG